MVELTFDWLLPYWPMILSGVALTVRLTIIGGCLGFALGLGTAWTRIHGPRPLRALVASYVEAIRNTPFLVQLLFVFFGLPALGLRLTAEASGIIALVVNAGAYMGEIIRGGMEATPRGQYEAAESLAMNRFQTFRYVVLFPSLQRVWPALVGQFVLDMFGTSVLSQIAVEELTFVASFIQSRNFRAFETYIMMAAIYLLLAFLIRWGLSLAGRRVFVAGTVR